MGMGIWGQLGGWAASYVTEPSGQMEEVVGTVNRVLTASPVR